jgi:hypothetical protein
VAPAAPRCRARRPRCAVPLRPLSGSAWQAAYEPSRNVLLPKTPVSRQPEATPRTVTKHPFSISGAVLYRPPAGPAAPRRRSHRPFLLQTHLFRLNFHPEFGHKQALLKQQSKLAQYR